MRTQPAKWDARSVPEVPFDAAAPAVGGTLRSDNLCAIVPYIPRPERALRAVHWRQGGVAQPAVWVTGWAAMSSADDGRGCDRSKTLESCLVVGAGRVNACVGDDHDLIAQIDAMPNVALHGH
jgi:hypothetical protein